MKGVKLANIICDSKLIISQLNRHKTNSDFGNISWSRVSQEEIHFEKLRYFDVLRHNNEEENQRANEGVQKTCGRLEIDDDYS